MDPIIQKTNTNRWMLGVLAGFLIFLSVGLLYVFQTHVERALPWIYYLFITSFCLIGSCIGGLVGEVFKKDYLPRWFKFGAWTVTIPAISLFLLALVFMNGATPNGYDLFALIILYSLFPIPLFITGVFTSKIHKVSHVLNGYLAAFILLFILYLFRGISVWFIPIVMLVLSPLLGKVIERLTTRTV